MEETTPTVINIEKRVVELLHGIGAMSAFIEYMSIKDAKSEKLLALLEELGMPDLDMDQRFIDSFTKIGKAGEA